MIVPDVNVLLYAMLRFSPSHAEYAEWLEEVRRSTELGLAQTVLLGVVRVASNSRMTTNSTTARTALRFVDQLRRSPHARTIEPTAGTWTRMHDLIRDDPGSRSNLVPDAWVAALTISHGARLATADRGFGRFPGLDFFDPIAA